MVPNGSVILNIQWISHFKRKAEMWQEAIRTPSELGSVSELVGVAWYSKERTWKTLIDFQAVTPFKQIGENSILL